MVIFSKRLPSVNYGSTNRVPPIMSVTLDVVLFKTRYKVEC